MDPVILDELRESGDRLVLSQVFTCKEFYDYDEVFVLHIKWIHFLLILPNTMLFIRLFRYLHSLIMV